MSRIRKTVHIDVPDEVYTDAEEAAREKNSSVNDELLAITTLEISWQLPTTSRVPE